MIYIPIFGLECIQCGTSPIVAVQHDEGLRSSGLCGVCFFHDRWMVDWAEWNSAPESTE